MARIFRTLEAVAAVVSVVAFAAAISLSMNFASTEPHQPVPDLGRIYEHQVHSQVSYLTEGEQDRLTYLFWTSGLSFAVCAGFDFILKRFAKREDIAQRHASLDRLVRERDDRGK
jgi:hypothetical protein